MPQATPSKFRLIAYQYGMSMDDANEVGICIQVNCADASVGHLELTPAENGGELPILTATHSMILDTHSEHVYNFRCNWGPDSVPKAVQYMANRLQVYFVDMKFEEGLAVAKMEKTASTAVSFDDIPIPSHFGRRSDVEAWSEVKLSYGDDDATFETWKKLYVAPPDFRRVRNDRTEQTILSLPRNKGLLIPTEGPIATVDGPFSRETVRSFVKCGVSPLQYLPCTVGNLKDKYEIWLDEEGQEVDNNLNTVASDRLGAQVAGGVFHGNVLVVHAGALCSTKAKRARSAVQ